VRMDGHVQDMKRQIARDQLFRLALPEPYDVSDPGAGCQPSERILSLIPLIPYPTLVSINASSDPSIHEIDERTLDESISCFSGPDPPIA
jgi:hypothetical protein